MSPSAATRVEWARRLAQALVTGGYADELAVNALVDESSATGASFTALLVKRSVARVDVVLGVLSQMTQLPVVDIDDQSVARAVQLTPPSAAEFGAIGFQLHGEQLVMAFGDPPDAGDLRALAVLVGRDIIPALADPVAVEHVLTTIEALGSQPQADDAAAAAFSAPAPPPSPVIAPASTDPDAVPSLSVNGTSSRVEDSLHLDDLLRYAVGVGASDLHLTAQMPACIRLHGAIRPIDGCPNLDNETIRNMIFGVLPQTSREKFEAEKELDTSHSIVGVGRFRLNVFLQRGTVAAALRAIPHEIPPFDTLSIPDSIRSFAELRRGLVLVTGPTGSGKSTTLASLVDIINRTKPLHIVTVEDPIEFLHEHKRAIVNQREIGQDTLSFSEALRRVLREDPDVILVGEMRDLETVSMALTAAETGHLVFGTLHTQDAPQTIDRVIDVFPTSQQEQVRTMMSAALEGVVTQQLVLNADGTGRLAVCEVMTCTAAIRNLIRSSKTHQIYSLMQTGGQYGMQTMDQALAKLVREGRVSEAVAFDRCRNEEDLRNHLNS